MHHQIGRPRLRAAIAILGTLLISNLWIAWQGRTDLTHVTQTLTMAGLVLAAGWFAASHRSAARDRRRTAQTLDRLVAGQDELRRRLDEAAGQIAGQVDSASVAQQRSAQIIRQRLASVQEGQQEALRAVGRLRVLNRDADVFESTLLAEVRAHGQMLKQLTEGTALDAYASAYLAGVEDRHRTA